MRDFSYSSGGYAVLSKVFVGRLLVKDGAVAFYVPLIFLVTVSEGVSSGDRNVL